MRLRCARHALLLLVVCAACTRDVAVPELAGGVPPLSELRGVTLGMRASTLVSRRPRAIAAPYAGLLETVGPYRVLYEVPGSAQDGQAPPRWERLARVTASERLPSADSALHRWRAEMEGVRVALHAAPQCYSEAVTLRSSWIAVWPRAGAAVFVLERPPVSSPDRRLDPALIEFGVAPSADHIRTIFGLTARQPCDASRGAISHATAAQSNVVAFIARMYEEYSWETNDDLRDKTPLFSAPPAVLQRFFDAPLAKAILADRACQARTRGECNLSFGPIWDSQDPGGVAVQVVPTRDSMVVQARLHHPYQNETRVVTYRTRKTPAGLRIVDMSGRQWPSLLKLLQQPV